MDACILFKKDHVQYKHALGFADYCHQHFTQDNEKIDYNGHSKAKVLADLQAARFGGYSLGIDGPSLPEKIRMKYVPTPANNASFFSIQSNRHLINQAGGKTEYGDAVYVNPIHHQSLIKPDRQSGLDKAFDFVNPKLFLGPLYQNTDQTIIDIVFAAHSLDNIITEIEEKRFYQHQQPLLKCKESPDLSADEIFKPLANTQRNDSRDNAQSSATDVTENKIDAMNLEPITIDDNPSIDTIEAQFAKLHEENIDQMCQDLKTEHESLTALCSDKARSKQTKSEQSKENQNPEQNKPNYPEKIARVALEMAQAMYRDQQASLVSTQQKLNTKRWVNKLKTKARQLNDSIHGVPKQPLSVKNTI